MSPQSIREYAASLRPRYLLAPRAEKTRLLTDFCRLAKRHRKSLIRLLRQPPQRHARRGGRPPCYGPEVVAVLRTVWEASDYLCGKRLAPFIPTLVEALERHHVLQVPASLRPVLLRISAPTIDRLLRPHRRGHPRGLATTGRSHPALAAQVPVRTFGDWQDVRPGSLQADLVGHCGDSAEGFFLYTIVAVDVATGWTDCQAIWGKGKQRVGTGIYHIRQRLPVLLRELHTACYQPFVNVFQAPAVTVGRPIERQIRAITPRLKVCPSSLIRTVVPRERGVPGGVTGGSPPGGVPRQRGTCSSLRCRRSPQDLTLRHHLPASSDAPGQTIGDAS